MLIFNADDYGLTLKDSERIIELSKYGIVKSTTIVSNIIDHKAIKGLDGCDLSTGVHINLVEGKPLTDANSIIDYNGNFLSKSELYKKIFINKINYIDIEKEIYAQIENLIDNNIHISHIDTHQNTHILFPIQKIINQAAEKYKIKNLRGQSSEYHWFENKYIPHNFYKYILVNLWSTSVSNKIKYTKKIILNAPGLGLKIDSIEKAISLWEYAIKNKYNKVYIYEIPCHLCLSNFEYELYKSKDFLQTLINCDITIGSYYDL